MSERDTRPFIITTYSQTENFDVTVRDQSGREMLIQVHLGGERASCKCVFEGSVVAVHAFDETTDGGEDLWDLFMLVDDAVKKTGRKYLDRDACDHACLRLHEHAGNFLSNEKENAE
ncbi:hypothetical protein [Roseovarius sp.]|uniref:hypothetical protein n=1 Tax=Roseovarius sp. TaxID=1486281 RepID=UPI003B593689